MRLSVEREQVAYLLIALLLNPDEDSSLRESDISSLPDLILERASIDQGGHNDLGFCFNEIT